MWAIATQEENVKHAGSVFLQWRAENLATFEVSTAVMLRTATLSIRITDSGGTNQ